MDSVERWNHVHLRNLPELFPRPVNQRRVVRVVHDVLSPRETVTVECIHNRRQSRPRGIATEHVALIPRRIPYATAHMGETRQLAATCRAWSLTTLSRVQAIYSTMTAESTGCAMKRMNPKSPEKSGSQGTALQQQRALARWEGEGGASPTGPQMSSLRADTQISGSPTTTTIELTAPQTRDGRG